MANEITKIAQKTPIEVVLAIDDEGMTTASAVYEWLELNPSNFANWCKDNIINNDFAEENRDYIIFVPKYEKRGRPKTDYKLTAAFAKKLCMASHTERGEEAREYFVRVEHLVKVGTQLAIAKYDTAIQNMQTQLADYQNEIVSIKKRLEIPAHERSEWQVDMMAKLNQILDYYHCLPFRREVTMEYLIEEMKRDLLNEYGDDFNYCKDMYMLTYPHSRPFDFEVIEEYKGLKEHFERIVNIKLEKKADYDRRIAELDKED